MNKRIKIIAEENENIVPTGLVKGDGTALIVLPSKSTELPNNIISWLKSYLNYE